MCSENIIEKDPETLLEAVKYFADPDRCHAYMVKIKWPDGVVCCPECGGVEVGAIKSRRMFQCKTKGCRKQFSTKVGTIFEDSPLGFDKWLPAVWSIVNAKNGISSCELARAVGVTQKSAWHMLHRIRLAMRTDSFRKLTGIVEADDTLIGGKAIHMHAKRRKRVIESYNKGKTTVHGLLERGGEVRAQVLPDRDTRTIQKHVRANVQVGSALFTDIAWCYRTLSRDFTCAGVNHALRQYVSGRVHNNGIENFWSLLKRALKGTYVQVSIEHLQRYLDEQCRRYNARKLTDGQRFRQVIADVVGRRLTYATLTDNN